MTMERRFNNPFMSLRQRNFRIYWIGMCVSLIGTWMQNIAQPWLALTLTNDAFLVSVVSACQFLPTLVLSLFSGALMDRVNKRRAMQWTQFGLMMVAFSLAILVYTDSVRYVYLIILALIMGIINAFDAPCRQSIVIELVEDQSYLPNAIALNSMAFNAARVIGPSIAGVVIAVFGVGMCFLVNGISFMAILISLFFIRITARTRAETHVRDLLTDIQKGLAYVRSEPTIGQCLAIVAIIATFVPNFNVLASAFAKFTLGGNEATFGYLMSFLGVGSFSGAFFFAMNSSHRPGRNLIVGLPFVIGMLLVVSGLSYHFWMLGICMACTGFFFATMTATLNSTIQLQTDHHYRGRVMSIYTMIFMGSTPFGNLYAGYFTEQFSPRWGFISCGLGVLVCMLGLVGKNALTHQNKVDESRKKHQY